MQYLELNKKAHTNLDRASNISFEVFFPEDFMQEYTKFYSINEFFESANIIINKYNTLDSLPDEKIDSYVVNYTVFTSWIDMLSQAGAEYILNN